jgi:hypothetical protein
MMTTKLFNSVFENSLRLILLLEEFPSAQSLDMLYVADFMVSYGATFGVADNDLNGENQYKFSEFASRREVVRAALRQLVIDGMAFPENTRRGIQYVITDAGCQYSQELDSAYATEYRECARRVVKLIHNKSERTLIDEINKMSAKSLRKGSNEE